MTKYEKVSSYCILCCCNVVLNVKLYIVNCAHYQLTFFHTTMSDIYQMVSKFITRCTTNLCFWPFEFFFYLACVFSTFPYCWWPFEWFILFIVEWINARCFGKNRKGYKYQSLLIKMDILFVPLIFLNKSHINCDTTSKLNLKDDLYLRWNFCWSKSILFLG